MTKPRQIGRRSVKHRTLPAGGEHSRILGDGHEEVRLLLPKLERG